MHDIGVVWNYCTHCPKRFKQKDNLNFHLADRHNINVKWFHCTEQDCGFKSKRNSSLKNHRKYVHDIGDEQCEICYATGLGVVFQHQNAKVCRNCCHYYGIKKERIEVQYVKAIRTHFNFPFDHDISIKGAACQRYRPDLLWLDANKKIFLHVEIDEHQHAWKNGNYTCDERRISEIYDEFKQAVPEHYIVIRFNPDGYGKESGSNVRKKHFKKRRKSLIKLIGKVLNNPPPDKIHIIYMYYDKTNTRIARSIPHSFVFD